MLKTKSKKVCKTCSDPIASKYTYCKMCFRIKQKKEATQNKKRSESRGNRIREDARRKYLASGLSKDCIVCGYFKHFDVCHIKDICSFTGDILISEINDISNLIALCKNHHWEMDRDLLEKKDRIKIKRHLEKRNIK
jgi:predicted restriction endonuclease